MDLERAYGRLFGADARRGHLDSGFALIVVGLLLALTALVLFLVGEVRPPAAQLRWREAAIVVAAGGAPLVLLGIAWALPAHSVARIASLVGILTCFIMAGVFSYHYPYHFNIEDPAITDHAPVDSAIYLGGAAILVTVILTQIVGMYVRKRGVGGEQGGDWTDTQYEVPDSVVERDIEEAMRLHGVDWEERPLPGLDVKVPDQFKEAIVVMGASGKRIRLQAPELDDASVALRKIRKDSVEFGSPETDDASDALRALRKDMQARPRAYRRSWWQRFRSWLRRLAVRLGLVKPPRRRQREKRLRADQTTNGRDDLN